MSQFVEHTGYGFAGDTPDDRKLWNMYLYSARRLVRSHFEPAPSMKPAIVDNPRNRVKKSLADALQSILFSAFALEYRLRRVLRCLNAELHARETLGTLLRDFWKRLRMIERVDEKGMCSPPQEWANCERDLKCLVEFRNDIAHADYERVLAHFTHESVPEHLARRYYIAVVDAIKLINIGTGYDKRSWYEIEEHFKPLKASKKAK